MGVIPKNIRRCPNKSADGVTRWADAQCEGWAMQHGLDVRELPEERMGWEADWYEYDYKPRLTTFGPLWQLVGFYKTYQLCLVECRRPLIPLLGVSTHGEPRHSLRRSRTRKPTRPWRTPFRDTSMGIFCLNWRAGWCRVEMGGIFTNALGD